MKTNKNIIAIFLFCLLLFNSCQEDNYEVGNIITPTNIQITATIVGVDASNPYGDGSGKVDFITTADNAISYQYFINEDRISAPGGKESYVFSELGVNTYTVTAIAFGIGGVSSSSSINIDVLSNFEDQEAKDFLSGGAGTSKTWYWAADKTGNIGLGPNEVQPDGGHRYSPWFTAGPWWPDKLCMYEAEFVFTQSMEGNLTLEQLKEIAYTPGDYAASIGVAGESCHGIDVAPNLIGIKDVIFIPSSSIATEGDNPVYRGSTMKISDGGFMCWYVGEDSSTLEIIDITENTLKVRIEEGPRAWYCFFQTEKPIK